MGIFRQFPYSNFHEMNMDEIIKIVRELADDWVEYQLKWEQLYDDVSTAFDAFTNEFNAFIANLNSEYNDFIDGINVEAEMRKALNSMVNDGTFMQIASPLIASTTTNWLDTHFTNPTNPPIDSSLTVEGAAADAKATGDAIRTNRENIRTINLTDTPELVHTMKWETGGISYSNGGNVTSNARIRSVDFIPSNCSIFTVPSTRAYFVYAYDFNNIYAGALKNDGTFVTDGSESSFNSVDFNKLSIAHPHYRFRVCVRARNSDTVSPNWSELATYRMTNTLEETHFATLINNVSATRNLNVTPIWVHGTIDYATGVVNNHANRMVTKGYLPTNIAQINVPDTFRFYLYAYTVDGDYVGEYKTDGSFVTDNTGNSFYKLITAQIFAQHPNYRFKIWVSKQDGTEVTIADTRNFEFKNTIFNPASKIKVMQYNIGKYNYGHEGGLSVDVAQKILNYKRFFAHEHPDILFLQESTEFIDSNENYESDPVLYTPLFRYSSYEERETAIKTHTDQQLTRFSYIHTSGDPSAWVIYGSTIIENKEIVIVSGVLNTTSNSAEKIRALTKLTEQLIGDARYAIIGMDTNVNSASEIADVRAFMAGKGYVCGNWGYVGNISTYNEQSSAYHNIDNVFVKGGNIVNFERCNVYNDLSSDHYPVIADIVLY